MIILQSNDDFLLDKMKAGLALPLLDQEPNMLSVVLVSRVSSLLDSTAITKYHGSIHPADVRLVRALITRGYHIIAAIKWNSQKLLSGVFTPTDADAVRMHCTPGPTATKSRDWDADSYFPPLPMQLFVAKLRWTILA